MLVKHPCTIHLFFMFATLCILLLGLPKVGFSQDVPLIDGSQWLNGRGVTVYKSTYPYPGPMSLYNGVDVGVKWQCVELPQRLYTAQGWRSGKFPVASAYQIYTWGQANPSVFNVADNNGSGYVPVPGDMIIHDSTLPGSGGAGHVAVVNYVDGNNVYAVEQNFSSTGHATYGRSGPNGSILSRAGGQILGVVHILANQNTNGGSVDPANPYVDGGYGGTQIGTATNPFKTVLQAVNAASATLATIHIAPGTYSERIGTSKHIHFVTWGSGTVRIGG